VIKQNKSGFTIVELLIVIVVIAILASISIVAYNGIQTRANNSKTVLAVSSWVKAIRLYNIDNGSWPTNSCLGGSSTYVDYGGRCWAPSTSSWEVKPTFLVQMDSYIGSSYPEPSIKNITDSETTQYRGAMFYHVSATDKRVYVMFDVTECPSISGLEESFGQANYPNGKRCMYRIPQG